MSVYSCSMLLRYIRPADTPTEWLPFLLGLLHNNWGRVASHASKTYCSGSEFCQSDTVIQVSNTWMYTTCNNGP